jgi:hypothetical protein
VIVSLKPRTRKDIGFMARASDCGRCTPFRSSLSSQGCDRFFADPLAPVFPRIDRSREDNERFALSFDRTSRIIRLVNHSWIKRITSDRFVALFELLGRALGIVSVFASLFDQGPTCTKDCDSIAHPCMPSKHISMIELSVPH